MLNSKFIKYGAVSHECCLAMVNNLSKISKANISVSITGIAGPKGGTKQKPVGLVYIGIKRGNKTQINKCFFKNKKRSSIQKATVKKALYLIYLTDWTSLFIANKKGVDPIEIRVIDALKDHLATIK